MTAALEEPRTVERNYCLHFVEDADLLKEREEAVETAVAAVEICHRNPVELEVKSLGIRHHCCTG